MRETYCICLSTFYKIITKRWMTPKMNMRSDAAILDRDGSLATPSASAQLTHQPRPTGPHTSHLEACVSQRKQFWGNLEPRSTVTAHSHDCLGPDTVQAPREGREMLFILCCVLSTKLDCLQIHWHLWSVGVPTLPMSPALEDREASNSAGKASAQEPPWWSSGWGSQNRGPKSNPWSGN